MILFYYSNYDKGKKRINEFMSGLSLFSDDFDNVTDISYSKQQSTLLLVTCFYFNFDAKIFNN